MKQMFKKVVVLTTVLTPILCYSWVWWTIGWTKMFIVGSVSELTDNGVVDGDRANTVFSTQPRTDPSFFPVKAFTGGLLDNLQHGVLAFSFTQCVLTVLLLILYARGKRQAKNNGS